jgi:hypothetical protein
MALAAKQRHIAQMKKSPRVTFKMLRIAEKVAARTWLEMGVAQSR